MLLTLHELDVLKHDKIKGWNLTGMFTSDVKEYFRWAAKHD